MMRELDSPVTANDKTGIDIDTNRMIVGKPYYVTYLDSRYRFRKLENGNIEFAEVADFISCPICGNELQTGEKTRLNLHRDSCIHLTSGKEYRLR